MITLESSVGGVRIHAVTQLRAKASTLSDVHWVTLSTQREGEEVTFFMASYEIALAYASAINTCNDREAVNADENANANG